LFAPFRSRRSHRPDELPAETSDENYDAIDELRATRDARGDFSRLAAYSRFFTGWNANPGVGVVHGNE